jgi:hypothetical protein
MKYYPSINNIYYLVAAKLAIIQVHITQIIDFGAKKSFYGWLDFEESRIIETPCPTYLLDYTKKKIYKIQDFTIKQKVERRTTTFPNFLTIKTSDPIRIMTLETELVKGKLSDYFCEGSILLLNL